MAKKDWLTQRISDLSRLQGYKKPDKFTGAIKMDSNENFALPKQLQHDILTRILDTVDTREYPLGQAEELLGLLSKHVRVSKDMVGIGNGSDQIIDLILANFAQKNTTVLTSDPTFGFFEERCKLYGLNTIKIPVSKALKFDLEKFLSESKKADILYLDSPNNPTGFQFPKKQLERLIRNFRGLVILDEAYVEFADYSASSFAKKYENVVVLRTLSKAFGLAGLRVGYVVGNPKIIDAFNRVIQYPYPLNTVGIQAALGILHDPKEHLKVVDFVKKERSRIIRELKHLGAFDVFESKGNFVLFIAKGGASYRIYKALLEQGIVIKNLGTVGNIEGCLRVTVSSKFDNSRFLLAIRDLLR